MKRIEGIALKPSSSCLCIYIYIEWHSRWQRKYYHKTARSDECSYIAWATEQAWLSFFSLLFELVAVNDAHTWAHEISKPIQMWVICLAMTWKTREMGLEQRNNPLKYLKLNAHRYLCNDAVAVPSRSNLNSFPFFVRPKKHAEIMNMKNLWISIF